MTINEQIKKALSGRKSLRRFLKRKTCTPIQRAKRAIMTQIECRGMACHAPDGKPDERQGGKPGMACHAPTGFRSSLYSLICFIEKVWVKIILGESWIGIHHARHKDRFGNLIWEGWSYNSAGLVDQGEAAMLDWFFRDQNEPAGFEVGLFNDTPAETDEPTDLLNEVSGGSYARIALSRNTTDFPTLALDSGDYKVTSKTYSFAASAGDYTAATAQCLITTDGTPRLISFADLSQTRTILSGESVDMTISVKLA